MHRATLPKALAFLVLTSGLTLAGAQQPQAAPAASEPAAQEAPMQHHRHPKDPAHEAHFLGKKLNLTDDQTSRLEPILADRDQKMEALRANTQLSPEDRQQQRRAINQGTRQQMAGVLTPDQMEQVKAMHHEHRGEHSLHNQETAPAPAPGL